ncbi:MAG: sodium:proton antiporter [Acetobacteraceae bacterium]|nr:sodium:proton antiporter [Acetobacteraceae bacterium]MBV8524088.1 sodium:proton antiporter [Acetobacteraceae bacterium]
MQPTSLTGYSALIDAPLAGSVVLFPEPARVAEAARLPVGPVWAGPFLGLLLSIAIFPVVAPRFWERRMGWVSLFWILCLLAPLAAVQGFLPALSAAWHAMLVEYLPFVTLLVALFTVGGGILVRGGPGGTPAGNTALLAIGIVLAGLMGTTGAAMVLIHPLLRSNAHRSRKVHLAVFFIVLVANAGGATTPLGDPPLYIGFLRGVPFPWPLLHLTPVLGFFAGLLLAAFYLLDRFVAAADPPRPKPERFHVRGWRNIGLLAMTVTAVFAQAIWPPTMVNILGQEMGAERLAGSILFLAITGASWLITPNAVRQGNMFAWHPIQEVAILFAGIFVTIGPVLSMLQQGLEGAAAPVLRLTLDEAGRGDPVAFFWLSGVLSAFLDNAPTYLVFFQLAGGDVARLSNGLSRELEAIAAGSVFFGGLTYIGNAPNLMVRAIAAHRGVHMPGFFGYMVWSCALMLPALALITLLFFV